MGNIGFLVHHEKIVDSTQKVANELALNGAKEGEVVSANIQTAGRGQRDRTWFTGEGDNIAMSIILRPNLKPQECPRLTLVTAVAIVQAMEEVTNIDAKIKWPNDIFVNGKKLVGILTEMKISQNELQHIILGIGINVNTPLESFDSQISHIATSLFIETGESVDKINLMKVIFEKLNILYTQFLEHGFEVIKPLWEQNALMIGKLVTIDTNDQSITGVVIGISDEGILQIKDSENYIHDIYSADISIKDYSL